MTPDDKLDLIIAKLDAMNNMMLSMHAAQSRAPTIAAPSAPVVVSDADLDGPHGDPEVKFPPKDWPGEDYAGRPLSRTSASFCERMANYWDWQAEKDAASGDEKKMKYAPLKRKDAARARGWAARLKAREAAAGSAGSGDDIPF